LEWPITVILVRRGRIESKKLSQEARNRTRRKREKVGGKSLLTGIKTVIRSYQVLQASRLIFLQSVKKKKMKYLKIGKGGTPAREKNTGTGGLLPKVSISSHPASLFGNHQWQPWGEKGRFEG